ncbi:MAG TPA: hypothetical protein VFE62_01655 [Gemmataceae bacterium]|nr:hypothetical protein [Gemmataceae bacterium]
MSMLDDAIDSLLVPGLMAGMGKSATYARPGSSTIALTVIAQDGGKEKALRLGDSPESTDFVIITPELGYAGMTIQVADLATLTPATPMLGDTITIGSDVYTVLAPDGMREWRYEDLPFKRLFRVHTKLTS